MDLALWDVPIYVYYEWYEYKLLNFYGQNVKMEGSWWGRRRNKIYVNGNNGMDLVKDVLVYNYLLWMNVSD